MPKQQKTNIIIHKTSDYILPLWLTWKHKESRWLVQKISLIPPESTTVNNKVKDDKSLQTTIRQWEKKLKMLPKKDIQWQDLSNIYFLDLSVLSAFQTKVYQKLIQTKWGRTISYLELAMQCQTHPRAIGAAMRSNPFPIIIPCHRVLRKDGSLGGFTSGIENKKKILEYEGKA